MTTIDNKGLNAVIPSDGGEQLRIRVVLLRGKNGKGVWLTINRDEELSAEIPKSGENLWLLERPAPTQSKVTKCLDLWSRKIYIHARRLAGYYERGDTESIKRLVHTI